MATQRFLEFSPRTLGEMIQFDGSHIFQMGWFNHQLGFHETIHGLPCFSFLQTNNKTEDFFCCRPSLREICGVGEMKLTCCWHCCHPCLKHTVGHGVVIDMYIVQFCTIIRIHVHIYIHTDVLYTVYYIYISIPVFCSITIMIFQTHFIIFTYHSH